MREKEGGGEGGEGGRGRRRRDSGEGCGEGRIPDEEGSIANSLLGREGKGV